MTIAPVPPASATVIGDAAAPGAAAATQGPAPTASAPHPPDVTPQAGPAAALGAAVQAAAGRQSGLASLFAELQVVVQTPGLPAPVLAAASQLLGLPLPLDPPPSAADLRQAVAQSGLFLEAQLASAGATAGGDLKAALLDLGQALEAWLGPSAARPAPGGQPPAPPYRGGPVRGQPPAQAGLAADAPPEAVGARLLQATGGAIARQTLQQAASLPDHSPRPSHAQGSQWLFEVPLATQQGAAVAQFAIARDGRASGGDGGDPPAWKTDVSLHLEPMGSVHARIVLTGDRVRVTLWAENDGTAGRLGARGDELAKALLDEGLAATVNVVAGAPPSAPAPSAGRLVDQAL
jgi:hypothetical protein